MSSLRAIKQEMIEDQSMELVTQSLSEVASLRFKATKNAIQQASSFFQDITSVYRAVLLEATKHSEKKLQKQGTISLMLTSNAHFNGGLDRELSSVFMNETNKYPGAKIVIGRSGVNLMKELGQTNFEAVTFSNDLPTVQEVLAITTLVKKYSQILVYYSKFVTVLEQKVEVVNLAEPNLKASEINQSLDFILEPELNQMMEFFEGQILGSLLNSIFLGSNLARVASRMVSMDSAEQNVKKELEGDKKELLRAQKAVKNSQILANYVAEITMNI